MSSVTVKHQLQDWEQAAGENPEQADTIMLDITMAPEKVLIKTEDGREVWIELSNGKFVVHAYDGDSDMPVNLTIQPDNNIVIDDSDYRDEN